MNPHLVESLPGIPSADQTSGQERAGPAVVTALVGCVGVLAAKLWLIWRININWDEFNFLSHVHEAARGDLRLVLQGFHTQLFQWLTWLEGNEVEQIVVARFVMLGLLALTAVLLWRLAANWVPGKIAVVAPLCYLSMWPVIKHGASFRYDSLLAPLLVLALLLAARGAHRRREAIAAGVVVGVAVAISIKALLFVPVVALVMLLNGMPGRAWSVRSAAAALAHFTVVFLLTAALLLFLHQLSLAPDAGPAGEHAAVAFKTMILDIPFFPRRADFFQIVSEDSIAWILLMMGGFLALASPRYWRVAVCGLSLMPVLFYRNAWPYFYVVMLAPASVLAALMVESLRRQLSLRGRERGAEALVLVICVALSAKAAIHVFDLRHDDQVGQRMVIDAVHQVFPEPVAYIDHSGMIGSFRKANFFMSTWGVANYLKGGKSFMREAIARYRPPLLLVNGAVLNPLAPMFAQLRAEDRRLIESHYLPYWGPIRVAGAEVTLTGGDNAKVALPFPGRYRLETGLRVTVDGLSRGNGDILDLPVEHCIVAMDAMSNQQVNHTIRLVWADALPAPSLPGFFPTLYRPL